MVVSGGAIGIDALAHEGCLDAGGITCAVLGNGLDMPHPETNRTLFDAMADAGSCVLSESPMGMPPNRGSFPRRNRIIAGLADAVVVVQAGARSGALITAQWARWMRIPIFVVASDVWYGGNEGGNALLKQGARVLTSPSDLATASALKDVFWRDAPWPRPGPRQRGLPVPWDSAGDVLKQMPCATAEDTQILGVMAKKAMDLDALVEATGLSIGTLQAALLGLEIAGRVRCLGGGTWMVL